MMSKLRQSLKRKEALRREWFPIIINVIGTNEPILIIVDTVKVSFSIQILVNIRPVNDSD